MVTEFEVWLVIRLLDTELIVIVTPRENLQHGTNTGTMEDIDGTVYDSKDTNFNVGLNEFLFHSV